MRVLYDALQFVGKTNRRSDTCSKDQAMLFSKNCINIQWTASVSKYCFELSECI